MYYEVHEGTVESQDCIRKRLTKKECLKRCRKTSRSGDDWMSDAMSCVNK